MGGSAFTTPPYGLHTPRMPPDIYNQVKTSCLAKLSELYVITASPVEAPEKKDHGDVDILVADQRSLGSVPGDDGTSPNESHKTTRDQLITIGEKLQVKHSIILSPPVSANFAISWPITIEQEAGEHQNGEERFIQVDVRICKDEQQLNWYLFKHAHGDIWNMIGSLIRPYGLTADEQALWLRIREIEKHDRKQAKVKLTDSPAEVLEFIGMKYDGFWTEPFDSVDALYEYVTTCRLPLVRYPSLSEGSTTTGGGDTTPIESLDEVAAETRKSLKSNDRRRMGQRPVYRRWINEIIPRFLADGRLAAIDPEALPELRAEVEQQAFQRFPGVRNEYESRLKAWRSVKSAEAVKRTIKELTADKENIHFRGTLVSALKKTILEDDQGFGVIPGSPLRSENGIYDLDAVRTFIVEKGEKLGVVAWERQCERARAAVENKRTRDIQRGLTDLDYSTVSRGDAKETVVVDR